MSTMKRAETLILLLTVFPLTASAQSVEQSCLQSFPEKIQARIELRTRQRAQLLPREVGGLGLEFVIGALQTWNPGQTIRVAFNGGSYDLRKSIADAASEWCQHANLKLDFGHDPQLQRFREWTVNDQTFVADIRVSFDYAGYWSLVGTDSNDPNIIMPGEPSLNLGGFQFQLPPRWKATVLHEFGHALGFQHEHQHPTGGCDSEFRWYDDPGYIPTTDGFGQYIADAQGRKPGLYTVLGGPPNNWPAYKVDHNLRQLSSSDAYLHSDFDPQSIMKYYFPSWMFIDGEQSHCFNLAPNNALSTMDGAGAKQAYPPDPQQASAMRMQKERILNEVLKIPTLQSKQKEQINKQLDQLK